MNTFQIILLIFAALLLFIKGRKYFLTRNMTNYSAKEAAALLKNSMNYVLVDVRTDGERKAGFIKGSIHIPLHTIKTNAAALNKYKDKELICYCQSGSRSVSAVIAFTQLGFKASNMVGGIGAWNF